MLEWFSASFPETSYSVFRIHACLYFDQCNLVEVATEHPWISATALAFLSAFMLVSALLVIAVLLVVLVAVSMLFAAACNAFGNLVGGGFVRLMK